MIKYTWPDDDVAQLKTRWEAGESAVAIARAMPGYSEKAISHKAQRLGLVRPVRTNTHKAFLSVPPDYRALQMQRHGNEPEPALINGQPITLLEAERQHCRWIVADNSQVCGRQTRQGSSWCPVHFARCYVAVRP
jgi:hypothetical protein